MFTLTHIMQAYNVNARNGLAESFPKFQKTMQKEANAPQKTPETIAATTCLAPAQQITQ